MKCVALVLLCVGQVEFHPDLRAPDLIGQVMRPVGPGLAQDDRGVRITLPAGKGKLPVTGLMTSTAVHGDFETTLRYEILEADQPKTGYGVGVSLYAAIEPNINNAVSLARRLTPDGKTLFVSNRMQPTPPRDHVRTRPSTSTTGKLRIQRLGSVVQFLVQEDPAPEFIKMNEVEFSADDVRLIQIGANAGNSDAGLDVRLLDFTVTAQGLPEAAAPPAAQAAEAPPRRRALWPVAVGLGLFVAVGAVTWWLRSRRVNNRPLTHRAVGRRASDTSAGAAPAPRDGAHRPRRPAPGPAAD